MAAQCRSQPVQACCSAEQEQPPVTATQDPPSNNQGNEPEYDFVEQPDQDCFCPVSLELLTEPYLTSCCGHHISQQAVDRLIRERKPCPMCKEENFTAHMNKHFKRKTINTLKVRCPHKKNGCEWVGELGDLNNHSTSCPKRPWKCQYCDLETTFEFGTNEHTPNCTQYPLPCPNQCEIGTVPRCDAEKHLLVCPLQLVECEFANVGCEVKVPRRDLTRHMTENAQHHLMSATLLNLRLTRELHQKMEEKDQQIAELKQQLNEHEAKLTEQSKEITKTLQQQTSDLDIKRQRDLGAKLQQQTKDLDAKLQQQIGGLDTKRQRDLNAKLQQQTRDLDTKFQLQTRDLKTELQQHASNHKAELQKQITNLDSKFQQQISVMNTKQTQDIDSKLKQQTKDLDIKLQQTTEGHQANILRKLTAIEQTLFHGLTGTCHELTLTELKKYQAKGGNGSWFSDPFYNRPGGYKFKLNIDTSGHASARGTHLSAYLYAEQGKHDKDLKWPVSGEVFLEMLNQRGDHNHLVISVFNLERTIGVGSYCKIKEKFYPLADLTYNAQKNTEYLKNDSLKFKLKIKVC